MLSLRCMRIFFFRRPHYVIVARVHESSTRFFISRTSFFSLPQHYFSLNCTLFFLLYFFCTLQTVPLTTNCSREMSQSRSCHGRSRMLHMPNVLFVNSKSCSLLIIRILLVCWMRSRHRIQWKTFKMCMFWSIFNRLARI